MGGSTGDVSAQTGVTDPVSGRTATLVSTQRDDGNFAGSWDPVGRGVVFGGRLYATALAVLTIESYYCYTRIGR